MSSAKKQTRQKDVRSDVEWGRGVSALIGVKESSASASPLSAAIDWPRGGRGEAKKRRDKGGREQRQIKEGEETPEKKGECV